MDNDEQRDYEEEQYNRNLLKDEHEMNSQLTSRQKRMLRDSLFVFTVEAAGVLREQAQGVLDRHGLDHPYSLMIMQEVVDVAKQLEGDANAILAAMEINPPIDLFGSFGSFLSTRFNPEDN